MFPTFEGRSWNNPSNATTKSYRMAILCEPKKKKSFRFYMARNIPSFGIKLSRALAFFLLPRLYNRMNSLLGICVEKM